MLIDAGGLHRAIRPQIGMFYEMHSDDESDQIARAANGDRMAMHLLVTQHSTAVFALSMRMLSRTEDAEDVTQETFLRAWKVLPSWRAEAKLSTWLHRVALNLCYDRLRKKKPVLFAEPPDMVDTAQTPEQSLSTQQTTDRVQAAIATLSDRQRAAITLCALQGHSGAEAAAIMQVSPEAIESLLARARRALKSKLADEKGNTI